MYKNHLFVTSTCNKFNEFHEASQLFFILSFALVADVKESDVTWIFCDNFSVILSRLARKMFTNFPFGIKLS